MSTGSPNPGTRGSIALWGKVREYAGKSNAFNIVVGSRSLCSCLVPFDCAKVYCIFAFADSPITPADLPGLQVVTLEGSANAAAGYQESDWSEVTPGEYHAERMQIGGHRLDHEFQSRLGKHAVIVVSTSPIDLTDWGEE